MPPSSTMLGSALIKDHAKSRRAIRIGKHKDDFIIPQTENSPGLKGSVTELSSLDDFLIVAQLSELSFASNRNYKLVADGYSQPVNPTVMLPENAEEVLRIPRRPEWDYAMDAEQLHRLENCSFIEWRKKLALFQEKSENDIVMTPYELNLDIWRQLWRVIERSDLLVQIVDARNPLLFLCQDLERYLEEEKKQWCKEIPMILLLNKADLLDEAERQAWSNYFSEKKIEYVFYSTKATNVGAGVYSAESLCSYFEQYRKEAQIELNIGLVGYPNVGKSSTINSLVDAKRVKVGTTPGKTKHLQTIRLSEDPITTLIDCPGLIFPNFTSTKAELVLNGILPIDQMREYLPPCDLAVSRIPKRSFEKIYGISLTATPLTGLGLVQGYASSKGLGTDYAKAARIILKDYVSGDRIRYVHLPPGVSKLNSNGSEPHFGGSGSSDSRNHIWPSNNPTDEGLLWCTGVKGKFAPHKYGSQSYGLGSKKHYKHKATK